jgi:hypothetical protein
MGLIHGNLKLIYRQWLTFPRIVTVKPLRKDTVRFQLASLFMIQKGEALLKGESIVDSVSKHHVTKR